MPTEHGSKHAIGIGLSTEIKKFLREYESRQAHHGVLERLGLNRNDPTAIGSEHSFRAHNTFATKWAAKGAERSEEQHRLARRSAERQSAIPQIAQLRSEAQTARENATSSARSGWLQQAKVSSKQPEPSSGIAQPSPQIPAFATHSAPREGESLRQLQGESFPEFQPGELIPASDLKTPVEQPPEQATNHDNNAKEPASGEQLSAVVKTAMDAQYRALEEKLIRDFSLRRNR
jgi:hypothetical protein